MTRWLNPAVFLAGGLYIRHHNATSDSVMLFPLLEPFVGPDVQAQAALTWQLALALGAVFLVSAIVRTVRERRVDDEG